MDLASSIIANQTVQTEAQEVHEEIQIEKPVGNLTDFRENITDQITMLYDEETHGLNWTSCTIVNDGPDGVYVVANEWRQPEAPIPKGQPIDIDLKSRGAIKRLYLLCPPGQTATVRIYALK